MFEDDPALQCCTCARLLHEAATRESTHETEQHADKTKLALK